MTLHFVVNLPLHLSSPPSPFLVPCVFLSLQSRRQPSSASRPSPSCGACRLGPCRACWTLTTPAPGMSPLCLPWSTHSRRCLFLYFLSLYLLFPLYHFNCRAPRPQRGVENNNKLCVCAHSHVLIYLSGSSFDT